MKKYFILIIALGSFLFIVCEKEAESPLEVDTDIIDWWILHSKTIDDVEQEIDRCESESYLILDADERVTNQIGYFDPQFGCSIKGGSGWYTVSGNDVTFDYVDTNNEIIETLTYTFELNDDKLSLEISNNEVYTYQRK
ncbi:lipocalin family protein [uncultured Maribacter sp.]|uniref:lipocalin family protein n=1 Tax=uncultured Maribacter sp. TaxID=431308 RepID=UPI0026379ECD|nr:lipocalin family protein [uncultured Maribacter sp.]